MRWLVPLVMLLVTATAPNWAAAGCCVGQASQARGDHAGVSASATLASRHGLTAWTPVTDATQGAGCPCCPDGADCETDRCCSGAVAGSMLAGPPPFRVVLGRGGGALPMGDTHACSRTIARDARPPIDILR